ncbi:hypothetical protein [Kriegella aquimaris]|uniref:Uncharacterized protein n=1 Tax=Kriegella aquimaris TaxID=192904 RepID=A0A1G9PUU1_9FLAO|nr:hypothetical protein [Kriegella aquimaris]SDM02548.1 hypothetical protein SAMN04488514_104167 [Kriegella aquimaris]
MTTNNNLVMKWISIKSDYSFYTHLKLVIIQSDLVAKEILSKSVNSEYNGITRFLPIISRKAVYLNKNIINLDNTEDYEIGIKTQENQYDFENPAQKGKVVDLAHEHIHLSSIFEKQFINWWEEDIKNRIHEKYNGLKNASPICQFTRQVRNSFGHSGINVTANNCMDPIWNKLNLKATNGIDIYAVLSIADLINLWIEFEHDEVINTSYNNGYGK